MGAMEVVPAWVQHTGTALITAFATLATVQIAFDDSETSRLEACYIHSKNMSDRSFQLEDAITDLQKELRRKEAESFGLKLQIAAAAQPIDFLFRLLEGIESPAWVKIYDRKSKQFRMLYINRNYEAAYNITRELYIGLTDFEIHSEELAADYYSNDMAIMEKRHFLRVIEQGKNPDSTPGMFIFWKFYIQLPDQRELVAGIQISPADDAFSRAFPGTTLHQSLIE